MEKSPALPSESPIRTTKSPALPSESPIRTTKSPTPPSKSPALHLNLMTHQYSTGSNSLTSKTTQIKKFRLTTNLLLSIIDYRILKGFGHEAEIDHNLS